MPENQGFRKNFKKFSKPKPNIIVEDSPVLNAFQAYRAELDAKHDRHERIVKLSRDITIESKRIIFHLHSIESNKNNRQKVLQEAEQRLQKLININFKAVAKELHGQDPYQFRSAYSPGLQEFIEAYSFYEYFKWSDNEKQGLSDWHTIQKQMQYSDEVEVEIEKKQESLEEPATLAEAVNTPPNEEVKALEPVKFEFFMDPTEYVLGISDLTGELMRRCVNSLGCGETNECVETCKALQNLYTCYISLRVQRCRELSRKVYTMRQSVIKAENVCYNVKVRGGEAAKWGSVFDNKPGDDIDEGFF
ncbi:translin-associated protein X-like [Teleopsis dalmanni]|uniref:translin-associated protein X-like n=1 Tax=Teleopsis dalmanni TaxID=139649 RepID=UPI0018CF4DE0|nr:translin-associated protein X-like [Teleopsis dalmanni]